MMSWSAHEQGVCNTTVTLPSRQELNIVRRRYMSWEDLYVLNV